MKQKRKLSLLIMAAGMGSRYGGAKQVEAFGPHGSTLMDYSLYDALEVGFSKVVFVVREEIQDMVEELFLSKLKGRAEAQCVIQSLDRFVPAQRLSPDRTKPWGTAHAVLCGKEALAEPFAVINADDFYGRDAFQSLAEFLTLAHTGHHAMVGYTLRDVLSEHGGVSRGIAEQNEQNELISLTEVTQIRREGNEIVSGEGSAARTISSEAKASMNAWGFMPDIFPVIEDAFTTFLTDKKRAPSAELYIGSFVTDMIQKKLGRVHIISGGSIWFGVTYRQDAQEVRDKITALIRRKQYPERLW